MSRACRRLVGAYQADDGTRPSRSRSGRALYVDLGRGKAGDDTEHKSQGRVA
jgi:hypothetical protein